jgi:hypothetical protein
MQDAGQENDTFLLNTVAANPNPIPANPKNWAQRAVKYRNLINNNYTPPKPPAWRSCPPSTTRSAATQGARHGIGGALTIVPALKKR